MWNVALMNLGQAPIIRPPVIEQPPQPRIKPTQTAAQLKARQAAIIIANAKRAERKEADKRSILDYVYLHQPVTRRAIALRFEWSEGKTSDMLTLLLQEGRITKMFAGKNHVLWTVVKK